MKYSKFLAQLLFGLVTVSATTAAIAATPAATMPTSAVMVAPVSAYSIKAHDALGVYGTRTSLRASLSGPNDLGYKQIAFAVDGVPAGMAHTDGQGIASITFSMPPGFTIGDHVLEALLQDPAPGPRVHGKARLAVLKQATGGSIFANPPDQESPTKPRTFAMSGSVRGAGSQTGLSGRMVKLFLDTTLLETVATDPSGHYGSSRLTIPANVAAGTHVLKALFEGDSHYLPSQVTYNYQIPALLKGEAYVALPPTFSPTNLIVGQTFAVAAVIKSGTSVQAPGIPNLPVRIRVIQAEGGDYSNPGEPQEATTNALGVATANFTARKAGTFLVRVFVLDGSGYTDMTASDPTKVGKGNIGKAGAVITANIGITKASLGQQIPVHVKLRNGAGQPISGNVMMESPSAPATYINAGGEKDILYTVGGNTLGERIIPVLFAGNENYFATKTHIKLQVVPNEN